MSADVLQTAPAALAPGSSDIESYLFRSESYFKLHLYRECLQLDLQQAGIFTTSEWTNSGLDESTFWSTAAALRTHLTSGESLESLEAIASDLSLDDNTVRILKAKWSLESKESIQECMVQHVVNSCRLSVPKQLSRFIEKRYSLPRSLRHLQKPLTLKGLLGTVKFRKVYYRDDKRKGEVTVTEDANGRFLFSWTQEPGHLWSTVSGLARRACDDTDEEDISYWKYLRVNGIDLRRRAELRGLAPIDEYLCRLEGVNEIAHPARQASSRRPIVYELRVDIESETEFRRSHPIYLMSECSVVFAKKVEWMKETIIRPGSPTQLRCTSLRMPC